MFHHSGTFMKEWVDRAVSFAKTLFPQPDDAIRSAASQPPMLDEEFRRLRESLETSIPFPIEMFLRCASSCCDFRYYYVAERIVSADEPFGMVGSENLYGGARICDSKEMAEWLGLCRGGADAISEISEQFQVKDGYADLWRRAFPFTVLRNGDILALDVGVGDEPAPVVYLTHNYIPEDIDAIRPIAPDFEAFLRMWEAICYLGPELWMIADYIDPNTGYLNPSKDQTRELRRRLGILE